MPAHINSIGIIEASAIFTSVARMRERNVARARAVASSGMPGRRRSRNVPVVGVGAAFLRLARASLAASFVEATGGPIGAGEPQATDRKASHDSQERRHWMARHQ